MSTRYDVGDVVRLRSDLNATQPMTVKRYDWNQVAVTWIVDGDIVEAELPPDMFLVMLPKVLPIPPPAPEPETPPSP